jgi:hypothetical protein
VCVRVGVGWGGEQVEEDDTVPVPPPRAGIVGAISAAVDGVVHRVQALNAPPKVLPPRPTLCPYCCC